MSESEAKPRVPSAFSPIVLKALLNRLGRMTASTAGLDSIFKTLDYSAPLVIALLGALAKLSAKLRTGGGASLSRKAAGWKTATDAVKETRVIIRIAGLIPVIQGLLALYPQPLASLKSLITGSKVAALSSPKTIPTIQVFSLLAYYVSEHIAWLASKGVLDVSPAGQVTAMKVLVQSWAVYVVFAVYNLYKQYYSLKHRTRVLQNKKRSLEATATAQGYELQEKSDAVAEPEAAVALRQEAAAIKSEWQDFTSSALLYGGFGPLTAHWIRPFIDNPLVYSVLGTISSAGSVLGQWKAAGAA